MKPSWKIIFNDLNLNEKLNNLNKLEICPKTENVFKCFTYFDVLETKVVICGQDPYHTDDVATGLAFECNGKVQPSLRNIFKEIKRTYPDSECNIEEWAQQGVLLFNRAFTVETKKPNSHSKYWKSTTNEMITLLNKYWKENDKRIIFMLWGRNAQELETFIDIDYHIILKHTHPSPLSRKPFIGNNHFVICNEHLNDNIVW